MAGQKRIETREEGRRREEGRGKSKTGRALF
jgi:hypothetical protein